MAVAYLEIDLSLTPVEPWREVMVAQMGLLGFESFVDTPSGFRAYIPQTDFQEKDFLQIEIFDIQGLKIEWQTKVIAPENWNRQWEENFSPIRVRDRCLVRADFHPPEEAEYELVITPKMSFGTGHHETTQLMISVHQGSLSIARTVFAPLFSAIIAKTPVPVPISITFLS